MLDDRRVEELSSGRERGAGIRVVIGETTGYAHTADLSEAGLLAAAEAASAVARQGGGGTRTVALAGALGAHGAASRDPPERGGQVGQAGAAGPGRRRRPVGRGRHHPGLRRLRRQPPPGPRSPPPTACWPRTTRSGPASTSAAWPPATPACRPATRALARTEGFEVFGRVAVEEIARTAAGPGAGQAVGPPGPVGRGAGRAGRRQRRHPVPRGLRPRPRGRPHREGRVGLRRARSASWWPARSSPWSTTGPSAASGGTTRSTTRDGRPPATCSSRTACSPTTCGTTCGPARRVGVSSGNGRRQSYQHLPMVRMTNTYLLAGDEDPDEVIAQTPRGVYVAKLGGGQVNTATGDFVFGTSEAYLIEDGRITEPLRDANLIGNGPDVLRRIDVVATDFAMMPGTCGKDGQSVPVGCGQATLRITGVTIGGHRRVSDLLRLAEDVDRPGPRGRGGRGLRGPGPRPRGPRLRRGGRVARLGHELGHRRPGPADRRGRRRPARVRLGGLARRGRGRRRRSPRPATTPPSPRRTPTSSSPRPTAWRRPPSTCGTRPSAETPTERKVAMALELERQVRAHPQVRQVDSADYGDERVEVALASTTGIRATNRRTGSFISVSAIAGEGSRHPDRHRLQRGPLARRPGRRRGGGRRDLAVDPPARRHQGALGAPDRRVRPPGGLHAARRRSRRRSRARPW